MHLPKHNASPQTRSVELTIFSSFYGITAWPMDRFQCVAEILLDSQWTSETLEQTIARFTHSNSSTKKRLSAELIAVFSIPPSRSVLVSFLKKQQYRLRLKPIWNKVEIVRLFDVESNRMRAAVSAEFATAIPALPTVGSLAQWCGIPVGLVDWLSKHWKDHYRVCTTPKRSGGIRLLEAPRARLKAIQRKIANDLLIHVPCHSSAHGFVRGR